MVTANIDFETKCVLPISVGASKYSKACDVMCLAYSIDGGPVKAWWPGQPEPTDLLDAVRGGCITIAWNAAFERAVWKNCMVAKYGWPEVHYKQWRCTMAEALAAGLPGSLEQCAIALGLKNQKDMVGRRLMLKWSKPRKPRKAEIKEYEAKGQKIPTLWCNDPTEFMRIVDYCKLDVVVEADIASRIRRLSERELGVFHYDSVVNDRGVQIDIDLAKAAVQLWNKHTARLEQELERITFGGISSAGMVAKIVSLLGTIGCFVPGLDKGTVTEALGWSHIGRTARRILEIRQELGLSSIKKFQTMIDCADKDGRVRGALQYHGARTGRFAGRLIQPQNYARGELSDEQIEMLIPLLLDGDIEAFTSTSPLPIARTLSSMLRSTITAGPGKKLVVCDFASVEARGVAWAAGEQWMIDAFAGGADIYKEMASSVFKVKVDQVDKPQRFIGKQLVLGCGYQLGAEGFQRNLRDQFGVDLELDFCKECVDGYRSSCPNVKKLWYKLENAMVNAVKAGGVHKAGPYAFYVKGDWLYMRMPCGRDVSYYKPELRPGKYGPQVSYIGTDVTGKPVREMTYAGKICENCLAEGTLVLTQNGWKAIELVSPNDLVHDGNGWVMHDGLVNKGMQPVGELHGVYLTGDHNVWTNHGWAEASQLKEFTWTKVRELRSNSLLGFRWQKELVAMPVCMWQRGRDFWSRSLKTKGDVYKVLRLHESKNHRHEEHQARHVSASCLLRLAINGGSLQLAYPPRMAQLWWQRNQSLRPLERIIRKLLGRYGAHISAWSLPRSNKQRWQLRKEQLPVGNVQRTSEQQKVNTPCERGRTEQVTRYIQKHLVLPTVEQLANGQTSAEAKQQATCYDIKNTGPQNRFIVLSNKGPMLVHNCTQAVCRDLMVEAMSRLEKAGYSVLLSVHDELVCEVDENFGSAEEMREIMTQVPEWATGFPIGGESWEGKRYKK